MLYRRLGIHGWTHGHICDLQRIHASHPPGRDSHPVFGVRSERFFAAAALLKLSIRAIERLLPFFDTLLPERVAVACDLGQLLAQLLVGERQKHRERVVEISEIHDLARRDRAIEVEEEEHEDKHHPRRDAPKHVAARKLCSTALRPPRLRRESRLRCCHQALRRQEHDADRQQPLRMLWEGRAHFDHPFVARGEDVVDQKDRDGPQLHHDPGTEEQLQPTHTLRELVSGPR
mmetsp:Transcript_106843/g.278999  ORF Transcript_106843/g.278999 Transcript_106843/m.278999 type:complete len:232 (-) Transcript_106843:1665-2360(-)